MELQKLIDGLKAHRNGAASYESVDEAIRVFEAMRDVDGEKVCKGLACHAHMGVCGEGCPYSALGACSKPLCADALALIRQQQERIAELEAGSKWISVKARPPEEYGNYIAVVDGEATECTYSGPFIKGIITGWSTCEADGMKWLRDEQVTHWMPLPEPPKEEEHADGA